MKWLEMVPLIEGKLRSAEGVIVADALLLNHEADVVRSARNYMRMPKDLDILNLAQAKPYYLFHLSKKSPEAYKIAFEVVFRDAYGARRASSDNMALTTYLDFSAQHALPIPLWLSNLIVWSGRTDQLMQLVKSLPERYLFNVAAAYRSKLPDPSKARWEPMRQKNAEDREAGIRLFNAGLAARNDVWGSMHPSMFWNMVPETGGQRIDT